MIDVILELIFRFYIVDENDCVDEDAQGSESNGFRQIIWGRQCR